MLQLTAGETVLTVLCDRFPARLRRYRVLITALFCVFSFVVSLPFATQVSDVMLCLVFRQPPESVQHAVAEGSEIAIALLGALPASQNVTDDILHEKPEEWPPCLLQKLKPVATVRKGCGWECSAVGRAFDRHAADTGSIPRCGEGFFFRSQLSVQTLLRCPHTPVRNRLHLHLDAHVKDPVVHVRVRWIMETLNPPANIDKPQHPHHVKVSPCGLDGWKEGKKREEKRSNKDGKNE